MFKSNRQLNPDRVPRYSHSPVTIEYLGIKASITSNGKVIFSSFDAEGDLLDEIMIPAKLIFKMATLLTETRQVRYVDVSEAKKLSEGDKAELEYASDISDTLSIADDSPK